MALIKVLATRNIKHGRVVVRNKKEVNDPLYLEQGLTYELEDSEIGLLIQYGALEVVETDEKPADKPQ